MTYSPECVAEFEAKFPCEFTRFDVARQSFAGSEGGPIHIGRGRMLAAFAVNWERARELEKENAALLKIIRDEESRQARKLLEKGDD